jgi:hypothetical protein
MIVSLGRGDELGISGDIPVHPCHIGASPIIGRSEGTKDIVESDVRDADCVTGESGFMGKVTEMAGRYTLERQNNEGAKRYLTRRPSLEDWHDTDIALYGVGRVVNSSLI